MLDLLSTAYNKKKLIPCIGAGLSSVFSLPNWDLLINTLSKNLIEFEYDNDRLELLLSQYQYMDAVSLLKDCLSKAIKREKTETIIQMETANIILKYQRIEEKNRFSDDNNYIDLLKIGFPHYLTFNYDNIFEGVAECNGYVLSSRIFKDYVIDTQFMSDDFNNPILWHLHGDIQKINSIILSKHSYNSLYINEEYKRKLEFFINSYTFLFIGVSFNDEYIKKFFYNNKEIFRLNQHYILLPDTLNPNEEEFKQNYGLHVIKYETIKGHIQGIRSKLSDLCVGKEDEIKNKNIQGCDVNINSAKQVFVSYGTQNNVFN